MNLIESIFPVYAARRQAALFECAQYKAAINIIESTPSFAQDTDEGRWNVVGQAGKMPGDYTEFDFNAMRDSARKMYYKDPSARGIIESIVNYVIGKDCTFAEVDDNPDVQAYWDGWSVYNQWDLRAKEFFRRLLRDGEVFLRTFPPKSGDYQIVRFIDPAEIQNPNGLYGWGVHSFGIECDPDDIETPINYYRRYTITLPNGAEQPNNWEQIPAAEIIHCKIMVDSDVKRGLSYLIGISEYMTKYKSWLDDRIRLNKIRSIFNFVMKPQGAGSAAALKSQFSDVTGRTPTGGTANKQLPKSGSVLIAKGVDYEYQSLNINASDTKDDGRAIELMTCKGTCLPEYIVRGDASNANYASTSVSESPAIKAFEAFQDMIEKPFQRLYREQIQYGIGSGKLPDSSTKTETEMVNGVETPKEETVPTSVECSINFAVLVHRDPEAETRSLVLQNNQGLVSKDTAMSRLGYDPAEEGDKIDKEKQADDKRMNDTFGIGDTHGTPEKDNTNAEIAVA